MKIHPITILRTTGLLDGISLLLLLAVAMPLKYVWGHDEAVTIMGSVHGGIFVLYGLSILYAALKVRWSLLWPLAAFAAAFVPLGNFVLDWQLKKAQSKYAVGSINVTLLVYSIVFFSFFDLFAQLPVMSTFATSVGASAFVAGFVIGLYSLSNTIGNILSGFLTDKLGPFRMLMVGLLLSSGALLLYHIVDSPALLIAVRIIHGFVAGLIVPAAFTFSANTTAGNEQGKKVAITGTFVGLAAIVGPAFSGITASKTSVPFVFACVAALGLLLAVLSALFLNHLKAAPNKQSDGALTRQARPFINAGIAKAYAGAFFLMFSQGVIAYLLPLHVQSLGYDSRLSGTLMSVFGIVAVLVFVLPTNRIFDRVSPAITMAVGVGLMGVSQLLIGPSSSSLALYGVMALYGIGFGFLFPSINTMLIRSTPSGRRGRAYGYFYAFFSLGVVAGSSTLGWLSLGIQQGFLLTGFILLAVAVVSAVGKRSEQALGS
ncbi:multidrug transporter [Paenibacillus sp. MY03]|uniref:MFS transporter n=1 Tax=Paenibacillus sp. MY03 TaxID=302980 RepID=UPI000B3C1481|nr:MFS transporter [Paenibacillus sp. MY03]OUS68379.1 multidrug transporter [Paenibacillus sp. MY03]